MPRIALRAFGIAIFALGGLIWQATAWAASAPSDIAFNVIRGGDPMGRHTVAFRQDGDKLIVEIAIDLEVRFAFVPVFRYSHRNMETWQNGRLVRLESVTNDDGTKHKVLAEATDGGLRVTDSSGRTYMAPADTIPTSYWNKETIRRKELLNSQDGKMMPVHVETQSDAADGVMHYRLIKTEDGIPVDVWYGKESRDWMKLAFVARGTRIDYELASRDGRAQQAVK